MEKELNIAAILKDKPKNIKLWCSIYGEAYLKKVYSNGIINITHHGGYNASFTKNGKSWNDGECVLFPSKSMRDWSKFAWKKGDVLIAGADNFCIFDSWANDDYTEFYAKFVSNRYEGEVCKISVWTKETKENIIKQHISNIEEIKCGKLNLLTLAIESKPQFKDGDVVVLDDNGKSHFKTILLYQSNIDDKYEVYSFLNTGTLYLSLEAILMDDRKARPATDSEKQQLFDALAKGNKAWDAEKKAIVDLPKKCELKPFDKVLVRETKEQQWRADLFSHYDNQCNKPYCCIGFGLWISYCIPYNDQTAHLLGTTDDWEGGEG